MATKIQEVFAISLEKEIESVIHTREFWKAIEDKHSPKNGHQVSLETIKDIAYEFLAFKVLKRFDVLANFYEEDPYNISSDGLKKMANYEAYISIFVSQETIDRYNAKNFINLR